MIDLDKQKASQNNVIKTNKRQFAVLSLIVLAIVLVIFIGLLIMEVILSLKTYSPIQGLLRSQWVGLDNIKDLVASYDFTRVIKNTLLFNILFAIMFFGVSVFMGYIITAIPCRTRGVLAIMCAFTLFMPSQAYVGWLIHLLNSSIFLNAKTMLLVHPFICALKFAGIPIMVIYILNEILEKKDKLLPVKTAAMFALASLAFIANGFYSMTEALYNPLTYETMDLADNFVFRSSFMKMDTASSSMGLIQTLINLVSVAILFVPIKLLFSATFKGAKKRVAENIGEKAVSAFIAFIVFAIIYFMPYILKSRSFDTTMIDSVNIFYPMILYLLLSFVSAIISAVIAAGISGAFVDSCSKIRLTAGIILTTITILTIRPVNFSNYLVIRSLGLVNTGYAIVLASCFSAAAAWAMVSLMQSEDQISKKTVLLAIASLTLILTAVNYANIIPQLLYMNHINISPGLVFRQIQSTIQIVGDVSERASAYGIVGLYGFIISLPSLLLFLTANILIPKEKLLTIISAGAKR